MSRIRPELRPSDALALSRFVQTLLHSSDPLAQAVVRRATPPAAGIEGVSAAVGAIDAALLADELRIAGTPMTQVRKT